jgi:hypothetical protein
MEELLEIMQISLPRILNSYTMVARILVFLVFAVAIASLDCNSEGMEIAFISIPFLQNMKTVWLF